MSLECTSFKLSSELIQKIDQGIEFITTAYGYAGLEIYFTAYYCSIFPVTGF